MRYLVTVALLALTAVNVCGQSPANRLTYLDEFCDPYYPSLAFPKLMTPQWVGEDGVEAVVTLGIDDMRETDRYETYLRPILERLKAIDGRAPVSIMTNSIHPGEPRLQQWLEEGLSIETHTADHPCPCLQGGDFARAKSTYDRCVDQIASIPNNRPVAFRFPCMDSLNTPSPRAFAEIINQTTANGNFLQISTSVVTPLTARDLTLPTSLTMDADGRARFEKYLPFKSFVNKVENYPYPYVVGRLCWEFPPLVPDDWQGQHLHGSGNPQTAADMQAAIDATVLKQGTANIIFHPGGWIRNQQMVDVVDHADTTHGRKVKFLNFRECLERINEILLLGQPLRAENGQDNGVRMLDLNADGYLDVCIGNEKMTKTRVWLPSESRWIETSFPTQLVLKDDLGNRTDAGVRFGIIRSDGQATMLVSREEFRGAWHFDGTKWSAAPDVLRGLELDGQPVFTASNGRDTGFRMRDVDADGCCEAILGNPRQHGVWTWDPTIRSWQRHSFSLPDSTMIVDAQGRDAGLRFVDIDEDGHDDVIFSNETHSSLSVFESMMQGWSRQSNANRNDDAPSIPMISRGGTNNGAWFANRHMWLQNEDTNRLPDGVDRRSFVELLGDDAPRRASGTDLGPPPKTFPGNEPREIVAADDGTLKLTAATSRIYGSTVVFEPRYRNLGYWQSADDRAAWTIQIPQSGEFEAVIDYACDNSTASNLYVFRVGAQQLTGRVPGTGTWDDYTELVLGRIHLDAGSQQAEFRPHGKPSNCLIDLRTIVLRPIGAAGSK